LFDRAESLHEVHRSGGPVREDRQRTEAIRRSDPAVIAAVVEEALPGLLRAARATGLTTDRAEDAVHAAVLVFLRRAAEFDGRARVTTWLHGILWRTIAEQRRALRREAEYDDIDDVMHARFREDGRWSRPPVQPDRDLDRRELARALDGCLDGVPERQRVAFTLREVEGFTTEEVCKILDVNANNVGVLLFRARNRMRECLEAKDYGRRGDAEL
jgi:RNA polymerase sigma-70 factor (ECF subfamily)